MIGLYSQHPSQLAPFTPLETAQIIVWKALKEAVKGFLLKDKYSRKNQHTRLEFLLKKINKNELMAKIFSSKYS